MPPSASSKRPLAPADGPGERALFVAEQLALEQGFRQGGAVDRDQGPLRLSDAWWMALAICSLPVPVSPSISTVILVWPMLLINSKIACMCGFLLRMLWKAELFCSRARSWRNLVLQGALRAGALDHEAQVVDVDRLGQEIVGAHADGLHRVVDAAVPGRDDHRYGQAALLHLTDQVHAVAARHAQVGYDNAVVSFAEFLQRFSPSRSLDPHPWVGLELLLKRAAGNVVVLDQENKFRGRGKIG